MHRFTSESVSYTNDFGSLIYTNNDGAWPEAGLVLSGNVLYGTASEGGSSGKGTVFAVNADGTGFTTLHSFTGGSDGAFPRAELILSGNTLYGTASGDGELGDGTVFSLSLPVTPSQLTIITAGPNVILTWLTNVAGFTLQSTPAITGRRAGSPA